MQFSSRTPEANRPGSNRRSGRAFAVTPSLPLVFALALSIDLVAADPTEKPDDGKSADPRAAACTFAATGEIPGFTLKPGFQLLFEGVREGSPVRRVHTVLDVTQKAEVPAIGEVEVRAVDEKEWIAGRIQVSSTVHYAICTETGQVYNFGDDTFFHNADGSVTHNGPWRAGQPHEEGLAEPVVYALPVQGDANEGSLKLVKSGHEIVEVEDDPSPPDKARARNVSDRQAREIALAAVPGEVMDLAIERKLGAKRIVVEVIAASDLAETDVIIDMETGKVLAIEK